MGNASGVAEIEGAPKALFLPKYCDVVTDSETSEQSPARDPANSNGTTRRDEVLFAA